MKRPSWILALPIAAALVGSAHAATIRDDAGMFKPDAVRQAAERLESFERATQLPVTVETINTLGGRSIDEVMVDRARSSNLRGLFVLIARDDRKIEVLNSKGYDRVVARSDRLAIRDAFRDGFQAGDFDRGLLEATGTIQERLGTKRAGAGVPAPRGGRGAANAGRNQFGLGSLLGIGLLILGVLLVIRILGSLFGGGQRYAGPGGGPMRPGCGGGPGYGGPGYGGGGGGFFSSLFGGIGGALAGNWIYDQFSGRHDHGPQSYGSGYDPSAGTPAPQEDAGGWSGTGESAGWDDAGGGGGDWGGGGSGGGDWGGGDGGGDGGSW